MAPFQRGPPPELRASKFVPTFGRGSKGEKMTFGRAWTLKIEPSPAREFSFHKIAEFRKIRKSTKKWSEKRPPGRGKNRLCDPICLRVGGLAAPAGTNMCPCGSRCKKGAKQASRRPTNYSKTQKNTEKPAWKVPRRDPVLKKSARALCEAAKTQGTS